MANTVVFFAIAMACTWNFWRFDASALHGLQIGTAVLYFVGVIFHVNSGIYASQVATLKEIAQVQLQILELQVSMRKDQ